MSEKNVEVMELIETLYSMVTEAWGVPLGNDKCIVERENVLEILNEIKTRIPVELAEAKRLVSARDEFIGNAKREAESIRQNAEDKARAMLEEQEIVRVAKQHSAELISNAEYKSKELRRVANEYVDEILRRVAHPPYQRESNCKIEKKLPDKKEKPQPAGKEKNAGPQNLHFHKVLRFSV